MYNVQHPRYFRRVLVIGIVTAIVALASRGEPADLAQCEKRMSREVCLHTLYP